MKKLLVLFTAICISLSGSSQKGNTPSPKKELLKYRVGLITSLPTDTYAAQRKVGIGSTFFEASYVVSKKFVATGSAGYLRYVNEGESFSQVPVMVGLKHPIDNLFYFGVSAGLAFYNNNDYGKTDFIFSPYIGLQAKKISFDIRYLNTPKGEESIKTTAIVISYTL